jgi:YD repeat-containing protein
VSATVLYDGYGRLTSYARTGEATQVHRYNGLDERVSTTSTLGTSSSVRRFVTDPSGRAIGGVEDVAKQQYGASATDVKAEFIWAQSEASNDNQPLGAQKQIENQPFMT